MNEVVLLVLGIVTVFSLASSVALLQMGILIDRYPAEGDNRRERSLSSPIESTKLAVGIFWVLFLLGAYAILQEGRLMMIVGITVLFALILFLFTALVFSFAVFSMLRNRKKNANVLPVIMTDAIGQRKDLSQHQAGISPAPVHVRRHSFGTALFDSMQRRE